jgi:predicted CoA-binding protein
MTIREILDYRVIAVVGLSSKPWRPSFAVSQYMQSRGYRIIPVNPEETEVLGEPAYASLEEVPATVEIVNVFRRSEHVGEVMEAAIRIGAPVVWMQEGVVDPEAAEAGRRAGIEVIMDRCMLKEHMNLANRS